MSETPELSVVLTLVDHQGHGAECVESWARRQELPRERYEVIVVGSGGEREVEDQMRPLLTEHDRLLRHGSSEELELHDHGAEGGARALAAVHRGAHRRRADLSLIAARVPQRARVEPGGRLHPVHARRQLASGRQVRAALVRGGVRSVEPRGRLAEGDGSRLRDPPRRISRRRRLRASLRLLRRDGAGGDARRPRPSARVRAAGRDQALRRDEARAADRIRPRVPRGRDRLPRHPSARLLRALLRCPAARRWTGGSGSGPG